MGEKIRDLYPIKIGKSELMIELNEGYTKKQGNLIHIQNKHFRYAITESEFLKFASSVLRAKCEMDYIKSDKKTRTFAEENTSQNDIDESTNLVLHKLTNWFEADEIEYRFIEGKKNYLCIIINNKDYNKFSKLVEKQHLTKSVHLCSDKLGFSFLYQMRPFEVYILDGIYLDFYFQLPCYSLTEKTWIPLDKCIQKNVWDNLEKENGIKVLDEVDFCIYRICWSIFKKGGFSSDDKKMLNRKKEIYQKEEFKRCMETVFFDFTDEIIKYLVAGRYDEIIPAYYSFRNY